MSHNFQWFDRSLLLFFGTILLFGWNIIAIRMGWHCGSRPSPLE
jgi:hypothetical protein